MRPMRDADLGQVMELESRGYRFPWPEDAFRHCLQSGYVCRVLERDGVIHGYGIMIIARGQAHIANVCVRPESQRRGLGTRIINHLLTIARHRGALLAVLEVRPSNYAARTLYRRMGFARAGVRKAYYQAPQGREDALVLVRAL